MIKYTRDEVFYRRNPLCKKVNIWYKFTEDELDIIQRSDVTHDNYVQNIIRYGKYVQDDRNGSVDQNPREQSKAVLKRELNNLQEQTIKLNQEIEILTTELESVSAKISKDKVGEEFKTDLAQDVNKFDEELKELSEKKESTTSASDKPDNVMHEKWPEKLERISKNKKCNGKTGKKPLKPKGETNGKTSKK